jgi:hypothetical protein
MRWSLYLVALCSAFLLGAAGVEAQTVRSKSTNATKVSAVTTTKVSATRTKATTRKVAVKRYTAKSTRVASRSKRTYAKARTTPRNEARVQQASHTTDGAAVAGWRGTTAVANVGPRPKAWCGWWMRTQRGGGPELNIAWNWSKWGRPTAPQVGAVVVWRHHVGEIVGQAANGKWLVRSGNYGGAVRTAPMSVRGAVFRI